MKATNRLGYSFLIIGVSFLMILIPFAAIAQEPSALTGLSGTERERVAKLIEGAKKEGEVVFWSSHIEPSSSKRVEKLFREHYGLPNFSIKTTYGGTAEVVAKTEETTRAGRNIVDIVWTSAYSWCLDLLKRKLVMEYESPEYKYFSLSDKAGLTEAGYWVSDAYTMTPMFNVKVLKQKGINTDRLGDSWWDFVDPKFKGMISIGDASRSTSHAANVQGLIKVLGKDYFRKLKANNPLMGIKTAGMREQLVSGEIPITLTAPAKDAAMAMERGAEVVIKYPKEGSVLCPFNAFALKNAPHPSSAKLFIDFIRSQKGQEVIMTPGSLFLSGRPGVRCPYPKAQPPLESINTISLNWRTEATPEALEETVDFWKREILQ